MKSLRKLFIPRRMLYSTSSTQEFDVVIVGGGMVGGTLAYTLRKSKYTNELKIAVLDPSHAQATSKEPSEIPDIRSSALSRASANLFKKLQLGDELFRFPSTGEFKNMEVWDESNQGVIRFNSSDRRSYEQEEALGYIVDNQVITNTVWRALKRDHEQYPELIHFFSEKVTDITLNQTTAINAHWDNLLHRSQSPSSQSNLASITLSNGNTLSAKLIIAADGPYSNSREYLGMRTVSWNYGQHAVVCTVQTEPSALPKTAYQRFLKTGPIAMLPMGNNYQNIVWSTDVDHAKYLTKLSNEDFLKALNIAFESTKASGNYSTNFTNPFGSPLDMVSNFASQFAQRIPFFQGLNSSVFSSTSVEVPRVTAVMHDGKRASFPLRRLHAMEYAKPRFALIGDAAHTVHPLAGQGVNLGFSDVVQLTKAIQYAIQSGTDIGSIIVLKQMYEQPQFRRNEFMLNVLEALYHIYGFKDPFVSSIRGLGMLAIDRFMPRIKEEMMRVAAGDRVDLSGIGVDK